MIDIRIKEIAGIYTINHTIKNDIVTIQFVNPDDVVFYIQHTLYKEMLKQEPTNNE